MKKLTFLFPILVLVCLVGTLGSSSPNKRVVRTPANAFVPDCAPPFPSASPRPADVSCKNEGTFVDNDTAAHRAQNRAKNSFCAKGSNGNVGADPILTTVTTFDTLEDKVVENGIDFGSSANLPEDRTLLRDIATENGVTIGEGTYLVFVGFMLNAHRGSAESVSCQKGAVDFTDVHIALARSKTANLCNSVTAEIIPHFRPSLWIRIYYAEHYAELQTHPLRIKDQPFFDGSHRPCGDPDKKSTDPLRRSSWEIHPVYSIDVCSHKTLASCSVNNESVWTPFDEWIVSL